jgi:hypothetical protein
MRAGMKLVHIDYNANQRQRMPAMSILIWLVCLSGIFWLSIAPIFFATRCGLLLPHDHVLLGGASESDLRAHLSAEAACASGDGLDVSPLDEHTHVGGAAIISMSRFEPGSTLPGNILNPDQLALLIPGLLAGSGLLTVVVWRPSSPWMPGRSYFPPPRDPPPKVGQMLAG